MKMKKNEKQKKITIHFTLVILLMIWIGTTMIFPGESGKEAEIIYPEKVDVKPEIDGVLESGAWKSHPLKKNFVSFYPGFGEQLSQETWIWMTYDDRNLYFAFRCFDGEPEKVKTSITKRDQMFEDDWVAISLDTHGTKQTVYSFYCNPNGIQGDILESAVSGLNRSPDFVWDSAGKLTDQGYQVEISIPLRSIGFRSGKEVKMGIIFKRKISRLGISGSWPEIKPGEGRFNAMAAVIYKNLKKPLKLELLPAVTHSSQQSRADLMEWNQKNTFTDVGIGIKYGLTSSITAELTINPDFSQVESDVFQVEVNQRYPLFYSEKRPFFMEGADIFNFFTLPHGFMPHAVHTRQIVNPRWGTKLTGTLGKTSFGILSALDQPQDQKAFFGIARGKYSLGKDNYWGLLYSSREVSEEYNRVVGTDLGYRLFKNQRINLSFLYSMSGTPGDNHPNTENTNGYNFNLSYLYSSRKMVIEAVLEHIGKKFRMDTAYLMRTGIDHGWISLGYFLYPESKKLPWLKVISPNLACRYLYDLYTHMDDLFLNLSLNFYSSKQGFLGLYYSAAKESWQETTYDMNRFGVNAFIQLFKWLGLEGSFNRGERIYYDAVPSFKGKGYEGSLSLVFQPNKNLNQHFSYFHSDLSKNKEKLYDVNIFYSRTTYQFNKYFFLRAVLQYNSYAKRLLTDFLASFTLIPGTVLHVGYGGLYESRQWQDNQWLYRQGNLLNIKRSFFLKASYLWRF
jgi:hypothetical protein